MTIYRLYGLSSTGPYGLYGPAGPPGTGRTRPTNPGGSFEDRRSFYYQIFIVRFFSDYQNFDYQNSHHHVLRNLKHLLRDTQVFGGNMQLFVLVLSKK